jgi:cyclophilin family peptidyl-prolyl cis-trans isomerase
MRRAIGTLCVGLLLLGIQSITDAGEKKSLRAVIEMDAGKIVIEFYEQDAPETVANFVKLAKKGFYDGLSFHRVVPGFVVQGGDPKGDGTGGPDYTIKDEFNSRKKHLTGTVAMARTPAPNSAGSQFYICLGPQPALDGKYTVFGQVVDGMDIVMKIKRGDIMKKVTIVETHH